MSNETELLRWIAQRQSSIPQIRPTVHRSAGDDLAVVHWQSNDLLLVGVDQVLDGVHFDSAIHLPRSIGRKAMNRNLSDCAAMACMPAFALISVALHRGSGDAFARELYLGIEEAGREFGCEIIGGDTGSWDGSLTLSVTVIGRTDGVDPITRRGAKVGDSLFVSGPLGGSILGRHMTFEPRITLAREIAATSKIHAMLDLSDGLSADLPRLLEESKCGGAVVEESLLPIHAHAFLLAAKDGIPAIEHALHDGEDHELLFAAAASFQHPQCTRIGRIVETGGMQFHSRNGELKPLSRRGWDHQL